MTNAELITKIKSEIERRKEQAKKHYDNAYSIGRCDAFSEMLNFIYGLEETEKPNDQWSEEDKRALNDAIVALSMYAYGEIPYILPSQLLEDVERLKSFHLKEKPEKPIEGLEEEIEKITVDAPPGYDELNNKIKNWGQNIARHFAQCGAEHAKEELMTDAVEGRVILRDMYDNRVKDIDFTIDDNLKIGDDVRIIVVKE